MPTVENLSDQFVERTPSFHDENASVSLATDQEEGRERWRPVVDRPLIEWGCDPGRFRDEDEGIEPPSRQIVHVASMIAIALSQSAMPPPVRVSMNGKGGLTFEWRDGQEFSTLEITNDQRVEFCRYEACRLTEKVRLL